MTTAAANVPRIVVVSLNWNAKEDTLALLRSITPQLEPGEVVIVVDNASADASREVIADEFPKVEVVANERNLGFAGGCNAGMERARAHSPDWILVLNNDTDPPPGFLGELRAAATAHGDRFAAMQPLLVRASDPLRVDTAGVLLPKVPGARDLGANRPVGSVGLRPREIFGANGAALLLRADEAERLRGFDDTLFILFEDVELALRLRAAGQRALLLPHIQLPHRRGISGASTPRDRQSARRRRAWLQRNIVALAIRAWPASTLLWCAPILLMRTILAWWWSRPFPDIRCAPLWRDGWRRRSALRRGLRSHGADAWFGCDPLAKGSNTRLDDPRELGEF
ncbi:MAG: glycosyltransferase family 2 protein [Planctomycetota bacterium]